MCVQFGIGEGSWQNRLTPTAITALGTDTIQISGARTSLLLLGIVGLHVLTAAPALAPAPGAALLPSHAGGYLHTVALKSDGTVVVFGSNVWGQLGTGCQYNGRHQCAGQDDSNLPVPLDSLGTTRQENNLSRNFGSENIMK